MRLAPGACSPGLPGASTGFEARSVGTPEELEAAAASLATSSRASDVKEESFMFDLTGKGALVTGASGGIGWAIAEALHAQGATVAISGTRAETPQRACRQARLARRSCCLAICATAPPW